jgi:hypothetical protein
MVFGEWKATCCLTIAILCNVTYQALHDIERLCAAADLRRRVPGRSKL